MKKLTILLISVVFLLAACGDKKESNSADNETVKENQEEIIALENMTVELDSTQLLIEQKEKELEEILNEIDF